MHARFRGHSALVTHSGLQEGGVPENPWRQEHTGWEFVSLHWLLGPQGDGIHGFTGFDTKINEIEG